MINQLTWNLLLLVGINMLSVCIDAMTYKRCKTPAPENGNGWCVPMSECKIVADISGLPISTFPTQYKEFLLNSICDMESNTKFCCLIHHLEPDFVRQNGLNASVPEIPILSPATSLNSFSSRDSVVDSDPKLSLLPTDCGDGGEEEKVSNAETAALNDFPFMALLEYRTDREKVFGCGGALINNRYVLTAAHCIKNERNFKLFSVRLGEHNTDTDEDCEIGVDENDKECNDPVQDIPIEKLIVHEKFTSKSSANDIALLRLKWSANVNVNNVRYICLPTTASLRNSTIKKAQVAGWGATEIEKSSNVLLKGVVNLNNEREKCKETYATQYKVKVTNAIICATGVNEVDTCKGDSGGPLFAKMEFENILIRKYVQLGVVSAGPKIKCGEVNENGGSLYTSVAIHMPWIINNLEP